MHLPVLKKEVLSYLAPKSGDDFIDATVGGGGHTLGILEKNGPKGRVLGIDADPEQIDNCKAYIKNFKGRLVLINENFSRLEEVAKANGFSKVNGIIFDLGMSSYHLDDSGRGFSFLRNEPLDMRYGAGGELTAEKIVNTYSLKEIEKILKEYSGEKFSEKIAKEIIKKRKLKPITTSSQLVKIVEEVIPEKKEKINRATRTFQALRIAVNDELGNLQKALCQAVKILKPEGRIVVISFHSLEDRIVKNYFREKSKEGILKIINKKPIIPQKEEVKINPRSRSAKLRAAVKIKKIYAFNNNSGSKN